MLTMKPNKMIVLGYIAMEVKGLPKEKIEPELSYRFEFEDECSFELIPDQEHNRYTVAFRHPDYLIEPSHVNADRFMELTKGLKTKKRATWHPNAFGGSVYIYPSNYKGLDPDGYRGFECPKEVAFVCRQALIAVDEDAIPAILPRLWAKHFDPSINSDWDKYEHYACNNYTREQMTAVIADLRAYIELLDANGLSDDEEEAILSWSNSYVWGEQESDLAEAKTMLSDFLTQYCDDVEGMMAVAPDMHWVTVMGP